MRGEDMLDADENVVKLGSPPHARGRLSPYESADELVGITPACAGKTAADISDELYEDGSPPHARGRLKYNSRQLKAHRITPACAGKTTGCRTRRCRSRDHPRMRGEDTRGPAREHIHGGSPPHARGRREELFRRMAKDRITPACAGKTSPAAGGGDGCGDHPRMRGEDTHTQLQR